MGTIYYSPEDYGLKMLGSMELRNEPYEFDIVAVWQDVETDKVYYAHDSGCSCPVPFEYETRESLTELSPGNWKELQTYILECANGYTEYVTPSQAHQFVKEMQVAAGA
jgi:hypothetical protein